MRYPSFAALARLLLLAIASGAPALAQDVTVSPVTWIDSHNPPDQLPVRTSRLRPDFPDELRKTRDIGWAMLDVSLDRTGRVSAQMVHATQPAYGRALEVADRDSRKFKPAQRGGEPVDSRIRTTVVFNPASASAKRPEATPRLLDATVALDPSRTTGEKEPAVPPEVVWAVVHVDANGAVTAVSGVPAPLVGILESCARQWRFAPARKGGAPVEADVRVPFIVVGPEKLAMADMVQPHPLSQPTPVYPFAFRRSGLRGEVLIDFVIDREGRVQNPVVVRTLNPGFNDAAIEAARRWRFEPGRVKGRTVNTHVQQSISFQLDGERDGGKDGLEIRREADQSKLPPELRYDTPPKMATLVVPVYPYEALQQKAAGTARVSLLVSPDGKVLASKVVTAGRPEFGLALQAAAELFAYQPAIKDGQPTIALIGFEQEFSLSDHALVPEAERSALALQRKHPERILKGSELDKPLRPTQQQSPIFPLGGDVKTDHGEARVEFLIDESGRVCNPRVVSASAPAFGYAAVQAVSFWRFMPPLSKGKPGVARVEVPFEFKRPPAAIPSTAPAPAAGP